LWIFFQFNILLIIDGEKLIDAVRNNNVQKLSEILQNYPNCKDYQDRVNLIIIIYYYKYSYILK